ncbi:MAG: HEAT repeat domain-containing protein [Chloroflexota bacterium]
MTDTMQDIKNLSHNDANIRSQAVIALGQMGDVRAVSPLVDRLIHEPSLAVREDITWALVKFDEMSIEPLATHLQHTSDDVRHNAVHVMGKIGSEIARPYLVAALSDSVARVRQKAVVGLGQVDAASNASVLIDRFADDNALVRDAVMDVLAPIAASITYEARQGIHQANARVRENCAALLGMAQDRDSVVALYALCDDDYLDVQMAAVQALGEIGTAQAATYVFQLSDHQQPMIRTLAKNLRKRFKQ